RVRACTHLISRQNQAGACKHAPYSGFPQQKLSRCALTFCTLSLIVIVGCDSSSYDQPATALPKSVEPTSTPQSSNDTPRDWKVDQEILDQLEPYQDTNGYRVRIPKGYLSAAIPSKSQPGITMKFWRLPSRSDKTMAIFMVVLKKNKSTDSINKSLDQAFNDELSGLKKRIIDFKQDSIESGYISGILFKKVRFQGIPIGESGKSHGLCYVGLDGDTTIVIAGQDQEPHHSESLKILTEAILSFQNNQQKL
ncbi:MAG: hypothetical protein JW959_13285, partial [Pirellulales bacterium]|nr:hypothetical protein [Pirellulales bacterium]